MVGHAGSTTGIVHADMTLARSKVKVKVMEHLNFQQLPKTAHFEVYLLRHFRVQLKTDGCWCLWDLAYSLSEPDFRISF